MKLSRLSLLLALAIPSIVAAQTVTVTAPNTVNPSGQSKAVGTTFIVNADGSIATIGGTAGTVTTPSNAVTTTQGTAANGGTPAGNPNTIAGSDGTNVRTIRTDANGRQQVALQDAAGNTAALANSLTDGSGNAGATTAISLVADSLMRVFDGSGKVRIRTASAADATTGTGLLGAGILGQYQTTLPTYTAGQFGTLAMTAKGVLFAAPYGIATGLSDGVSNGATVTADPAGTGALRQATRPEMYNGTSWDRVRGDTTGGLYTQERERSQFFAEAITALAANGVFNGVTRDGGATLSQWGSFSCFVRADQAGTVAVQGSTDATTWFPKVAAAVALGTSVRVTDRNDTRYSRCQFVNGGTANTAAPVLNASFGN